MGKTRQIIVVRTLIGFLSFAFLPYIVFCFLDCWYYYRHLIRNRLTILQWEQCFNVRKGQKAILLEPGVFPGVRDSFNAKDPKVKQSLHPTPQMEQEQLEYTFETSPAVYVRSFLVLVPGLSQLCSVKTRGQVERCWRIPCITAWGLQGLCPYSGYSYFYIHTFSELA